MQSRRCDDVPGDSAHIAKVLGAAFTAAALIFATPALAQGGGARQPQGFVETLMQGPRLKTTPPEAADWVRASRPPEGERAARQPPGPSARQPERPLLSADEIRKREAALESARARHDRLAGRRTPKGTFGSAARDPEEKKAKAKPACVLTCPNPIGVQRRR